MTPTQIQQWFDDFGLSTDADRERLVRLATLGEPPEPVTQAEELETITTIPGEGNAKLAPT